MAEKTEAKETPQFQFSIGSSISPTPVTSDTGNTQTTPQSLFSSSVASGAGVAPSLFSLSASKPATSDSLASQTPSQGLFSSTAASKSATSDAGVTPRNLFSSAALKPVTSDSGNAQITTQSQFSFPGIPFKPNFGREISFSAAPLTLTKSHDAHQKNKPNNNAKAWSSKMLESPWRQVDWTEETRNALMESIRTYEPACDSVPAARVLLIGPLGAGKSSFISSVQSVFYGRVVNRAMVGTSLDPTTSFTKQLKSFHIHGNRERQGSALILSDMVGLEETNSLTLDDTLAVIKGHVPDRHKFSACSPVVPDTPGYVKEPSLADKVHCVVFVVSASHIFSFSQTMKSTFHQLKEHITALGVHQVVLLTHVDKVCPKTASDISQVYRSLQLKLTMVKTSDLLGMPVSSIVPVKNYSEELELDTHTDTLLLKALDHILQYTDLHLSDQPEPTSEADSIG